MKLEKLTLTGFRSIQDKLDFWIKPKTTCLVGANEHGKTNLLEAVTYLNKDSFKPEDTSTVYKVKKGEHVPNLEFLLRLNKDDLNRLEAEVKDRIGKIPVDENSGEEEKNTKVFYNEILKDIASVQTAELLVILTAEYSKRVIYIGTIRRSLTYASSETYGLRSFIESFLPRVVFFEASNELWDSISLAQLNNRDNLEFEGLLKLAGVWDQKETLFENSTSAHKLLIKAERTLTRKVRQTWSQGRKTHLFHFRMVDGQLHLTIEDKTGTFDKPTNRSLGFRSFFSFYLSLYAETATESPEGFIFVFDEPGIHLHPQGQKDLLKEIRKIGDKNQVLYSTHSPFMFDRNNPTSTLLVYKSVEQGSKGTKILHKSYGKNWASLRSLLGIVMNDSFFYADKTLLVEGTSDRIYINALLSKFSGNLDIDLNFLSIVDSDRREEMAAMVRIMLAEDRSLVALVDSDEGGEKIAKQIEATAKSMQKKSLVEILKIGDYSSGLHRSIEDLLPRELYIGAVNKYIKEILKKEVVIVDSELKKIQIDKTLGLATSLLLVEKGLIDEKEDFSKTTTADFFCSLLEAYPIENFKNLEKQEYFIFCKSLKEKLILE